MKYTRNDIFGGLKYEYEPYPVYTHSEPVKQVAQCCPVCGGRGTMPFNFYSRATVTGNITADVQCRSCSGRGVVFVTS